MVLILDTKILSNKCEIVYLTNFFHKMDLNSSRFLIYMRIILLTRISLKKKFEVGCLG